MVDREKRLISQRRYDRSEKGRARHRRAMKRYRQTDNGRFLKSLIDARRRQGNDELNEHRRNMHAIQTGTKRMETFNAA